jgi:hypothetical protein
VANAGLQARCSAQEHTHSSFLLSYCPSLFSTRKLSATKAERGLDTRLAERRGRYAGVAASARTAEGGSSTADQSYINLTGYPFPLGPITRRATICKEIVKGVIWGFEQPQSLGGSNVTTNVSGMQMQGAGLVVVSRGTAVQFHKSLC